MCTCSKCSRRLEDVSGLLKKESQKQNVGPKETVMDNLYDLCSFKLRHDVNVSAIPSTSSASGTQRSNKSKGSSKKTKSEQKKESKGEGKNAKRRHSSESVVSADFADDDGQRKTSSRSMRSSPSSDAVFDERPPKKRKLENPTAFVSVLKVPPSAFPKEMCCGEDLDPSTPEDIEKIFLPDGALLNEFVAPLLGTSQKYQALIPPFMSESHFFQCAECSLADGELVVCKTCPRAYHKKCLAISSESFVDDNDGGDATTSLSGILYRHLKCPCHRCECDQKVLDSETEPPETNRTESQNYRSVGTILCELQHILNKLIEYDFGLIFATPGELS